MSPPLTPTPARRRFVPLLAILGVFAAFLLIVPPTGEFPSADDFDLAATSWHLVETGHLRLSDWPEMTLIGHVFWGALFSAVGGCSFFTLRLSMFAASAITAVALYVWCRRYGHSGSLAAWFAITFAVNPLIINLQYTFMTDLSGVAAAAILLLLTPRLDESSGRRLAGYSVLAGAAYCTRETACMPYLVYCGLAGVQAVRRRSFGRFFWLLAPFGLMAVGYELWLHFVNGVPSFRKLPNLQLDSVAHHAERLLLVLSMLSLHLLPVSLLLLGRERLYQERKAWVTSGLVVSAAVGASLLLAGGLPVLYGGEIFDFGLRMPELPAGDIPDGLRGAEWSWGTESVSVFRVTTAGLAVISAWLLGTWVAARWHPIWEARHSLETSLIIAGLVLVGMLFLYLLTGSYFERYIPPLVLPAMMVIAGLLSISTAPPRAVPVTAWLATAVIGLCSLVGIQDGMQRSRVFWSAVEELHDLNVRPIHIDAGLAYAGFYRFNDFYRGAENLGPFWTSSHPKNTITYWRP